MYGAEAREVIESALYGGRPPTRRSLHLLKRLRPATIRAYPDGERLTVAAGMLMARVRADELSGAIALAENLMTSRIVLLDCHDAVLGALCLEAALSEAYVATGGEHPLLALKHADAAAGLARELGDARWTYRSLGLQAGAHAMAGNHVRVEALLTEMAAIVRVEGWDPQRAEFMAAVGEGIVGLTNLDGPRLDRLSSRLSVLRASEPSAGPLAELVRIGALAFAGQQDEAAALAARLAQGVSQPDSPALVRECAVVALACSVIIRGEPARALGMLADRESVPGHLACLGSVRASAYLQLRDHRAVLKTTDACMRARLSHNLWSLPQVLVRRSIANLRLGNERAGLADVDDGLRLLEKSDPGMALFLLPPEEVLFLVDRLRAGGRRIDSRVERAVERVTDLAVRSPAVILPPLSRRESVVAGQLRSLLSFREIAGHLHVAPSTVKTQALGIYRKLGVANREEAVQHLERGGFFDLP